MPDSRVTNVVVEAAVADEEDSRVTNLVVEAAFQDEPDSRVTALIVEVAYFTPALESAGTYWGIPAGIV